MVTLYFNKEAFARLKTEMRNCNMHISSAIFLLCLIVRSSLSETFGSHSSWSIWIDQHKPGLQAHALGDFYGDEAEYMTSTELEILCPSSSVTRIECVPSVVIGATSQNITCDVRSGLTCKSSENMPGGCHDYKVRYFCSRPSNEGLLLRRRRSGTGMIANCNTWSSWTNDNHPSQNDPTDHESVPNATMVSFCPPIVGGSITKLECEDNKGEPISADYNSTSTGFFVYCSNPTVGVKCVPWNTNVTCADFSFRYFCACPATATNPPPTTAGPSTTAIQTSGSTTVTQNTVPLTAGPQGATRTNAWQPSKEKADTWCNMFYWLLGLSLCGFLLLINLIVTIILYRKLGSALHPRRGKRTKVESLGSV